MAGWQRAYVGDVANADHELVETSATLRYAVALGSLTTEQAATGAASAAAEHADTLHDAARTFRIATAIADGTWSVTYARADQTYIDTAGDIYLDHVAETAEARRELLESESGQQQTRRIDAADADAQHRTADSDARADVLEAAEDEEEIENEGPADARTTHDAVKARAQATRQAADADARADRVADEAEAVNEEETGQAEAEEDAVLSAAEAAVNAAKEQARLRVEQAINTARKNVQRAKQQDPLAPEGGEGEGEGASGEGASGEDIAPLPVVAQAPAFFALSSAAPAADFSPAINDGYYSSIVETTSDFSERNDVGSAYVPPTILNGSTPSVPIGAPNQFITGFGLSDGFTAPGGIGQSWSSFHRQGSSDDSGQVTGDHLRERLLRSYGSAGTHYSPAQALAGASPATPIGPAGLPLAGQEQSAGDISVLRDQQNVPRETRAAPVAQQAAGPASGNAQLGAIAQEGARYGVPGGAIGPPEAGSDNGQSPPQSDEGRGNGSTQVQFAPGVAGAFNPGVDFDPDAAAAYAGGVFADSIGGLYPGIIAAGLGQAQQSTAIVIIIIVEVDSEGVSASDSALRRNIVDAGSEGATPSDASATSPTWGPYRADGTVDPSDSWAANYDRFIAWSQYRDHAGAWAPLSPPPSGVDSVFDDWFECMWPLLRAALWNEFITEAAIPAAPANPNGTIQAYVEMSPWERQAALERYTVRTIHWAFVVDPDSPSAERYRKEIYARNGGNILSPWLPMPPASDIVETYQSMAVVPGPHSLAIMGGLTGYHAYHGQWEQAAVAGMGLLLEGWGLAASRSLGHGAAVADDALALAPKTLIGESSNQAVYRVMSEKEFLRIEASGGLVIRPNGSSELGITLNREYLADLMNRPAKVSKQYQVMAEFEVVPGTWDSLLSQSATHPSAADLFPNLPAYRKGMQVPQVKIERGGIVSILLGRSESAVSEFNARIIVIRRVK